MSTKLVKTLFITLLLTQAQVVEAKTFREYVEKFFGQKVASSLFGESKSTENEELIEKSEVPFPKIPLFEKSATSNAVFNRIEKPFKKKYSQSDLKKFDLYFVKDLVSSILNREAHDLDYERWVNVLDQGATREGVYRALVLGEAYKRLELEKMPFNNQVLKFSSEYLNKFLNKKIKEENLKYYGFYSLKRVVVERTLELMDVFEEKDLINWFAHFAADLAEKNPNAFNNKTRKIADKTYHQTWANNMSGQFIKAEVMIRLHKTFNYLQTR